MDKIIKMKEDEKTEKLRKIKEEVLKCRKCDLCKERIKNNFFPVIGEGNHNAEIIFCGEAPGLNEAKTGRPFCGQAGIVLDNLLSYIKLRRENVYICNVLKCRPPGNRDPKEEEIRACSPYLSSQIDIINPKIICPLGRYSMRFIFEKYNIREDRTISKIHGKVYKVQIKALKEVVSFIKIIPLYHPAVAVYNPNMIEILKKDFEVLRRVI